jgi:hypothetical protein
MTTFTTEDREHAFGATINVEPIPFAGWVNASPPHIVNSGASYEPIPFAGLVSIQDKEDTEEMLRHQLYIVQAECQRLRQKLKEYGCNE